MGVSKIDKEFIFISGCFFLSIDER